MHQVAHGITCLRRGPGFESPATCATFSYLIHSMDLLEHIFTPHALADATTGYKQWA
jgi:hypothetical protein